MFGTFWARTYDVYLQDTFLKQANKGWEVILSF